MAEAKLNSCQQKGFDLVNEGKSIFIAGKAGTGKTFLLHQIVDHAKSKRKNIVVLSFTGIAATNAGGETMHSFFKFDTSPYLPGWKVKEINEYNDKDFLKIRKLQIIIIDEISMVRCDLLDKMDTTLKICRKSKKSFGGVQMVFMGDPYQLSPVVTKRDKMYLDKKYSTYNFFGSYAYNRLDPPIYELNKVVRQSDSQFVNLLNRIRIGETTENDLVVLNTRFRRNRASLKCPVLLTTRRDQSEKINNKKINELDFPKFTYTAEIQIYEQHDYDILADEELVLCKNARVMFISNHPKHDYYNGLCGYVHQLTADNIVVKTDDGRLVTVEKKTWEFKKYIFNEETKVIDSITTGTFTQYPLKLGWAFTVHKSQGLTFERVAINAYKAFAEGQVYVAISRCKSLEGLYLTAHINQRDILVDKNLKEFFDKAKKIEGVIEDEPESGIIKGNIYYIKTSKPFFDNKYNVVASIDGYYLKGQNSSFKIDDYQPGINMAEGSIYVKKVRGNDNMKKIVHNWENKEIPVCTIERTNDGVLILYRDRLRFIIDNDN